MLTPGQYLTLRRQAARLSLEHVAHRLESDPPMNERGRLEWLQLVEADAAPLRSASLIGLRTIFRFDLIVLVRLADIHAGLDLQPPRLCRLCGCSEWTPCIQPTIGWQITCCGWADVDLCDAHGAQSADAA